jgi:hypothetical protein
VQIMGNGYLSLLVMVSAIVTAAEGAIKRNNHKHMQSDCNNTTSICLVLNIGFE